MSLRDRLAGAAVLFLALAAAVVVGLRPQRGAHGGVNAGASVVLPQARSDAAARLARDHSARLALRVADEAGRPVARASVVAVRHVRAPAEPSSAPLETETDASGHAELRGLVAGAYSIGVVAPPHMTARAEIRASPEEAATHSITLRRAVAVLRGTVVDIDSAPVPGARIRARCPWEPCAFQTASNTAGLFELPLPAGEYEVEASGPGLAVHRKSTTVMGLQSISFRLSPSSSIRGHVRVGGVGTPGATVVACSTSHAVARPTVQETTSHDDGTFELSGLAPGTYVVYATKAASNARHAEPVTIRPGTTVNGLTLGLAPRPRVRGRVVDGAGKPVAGVEARLFTRTLPPYGQPTGITDVQGEYALTGGFPGRAVVEAGSGMYASNESAELDIGVTDVRVPDIVLERRTVVTVKALAPDREPVAGALVRVPFQGRCVTDSQGSCELPLDRGKRELSASHSDRGFATSEISVTTEPSKATLTLERGATIAGIVHWDDGRPAEGVYVAVGDQIAITSTIGEFELTNVPSGLAFVRASRVPESADSARHFSETTRQSKSSSLVRVDASDRVNVSLVVPRRMARVRGRVVWPGGAAAADVRVGVLCERGMPPAHLRQLAELATRDETEPSFSDARGNLDLSCACDGGPLSVWAHEPGHPVAVASGARQDQTDVRLELPEGATLTGAVVGPTGLPVQQYTLAVRRLSDGAKVTRAVDSATGAFSVPGLAEGEHRVVIFGPAGLVGSVAGTASKRQSAPLRVVLAPGAEARGRVVAAGARLPLPGIHVVASHEMGDSWTTTDEQGRFAFRGLLEGTTSFRAVRLSDASGSSEPLTVDLAGETLVGDLVLPAGAP